MKSILTVLIPVGLTLAGCQAQATRLTDGEQLVRSTLTLLTSDRADVCVDARTSGEPLAVFRTMRTAAGSAPTPLRWHIPAPLRPPPAPSGRAIYDDEIGDETLIVREPAVRPAALPRAEQGALNRAALSLSRANDDQPVGIRHPLRPETVTSRWWLFNRLNPGCEPNYTVSNPVWRGDTGFVSVAANHWATTYALRKSARGWVVVGQFPVWIY